MKKKVFQEPLVTSQPIDVFFDIIDDGVWYTSKLNTPFSPAQVLQMAYPVVSSSRIYTDDFKDWRRIQIAEKT